MSKYLTFDERLEIQKGLKYQMPFGEIAKSIGKDRTTIAKEIKRYSYEQKLVIPAILTMPANTEKLVIGKMYVH